jgi:hypothetical protein
VKRLGEIEGQVKACDRVKEGQPLGLSMAWEEGATASMVWWHVRVVLGRLGEGRREEGERGHAAWWAGSAYWARSFYRARWPLGQRKEKENRNLFQN